MSIITQHPTRTERKAQLDSNPQDLIEKGSTDHPIKK